jgi:formate/nitrite transporter FocA (FNT family)
MFFVPMGIFIAGGADPLLTWSNFLVNNLLPVTLGNILGGGIFVAGFYWWSYLRVN